MRKSWESSRTETRSLDRLYSLALAVHFQSGHHERGVDLMKKAGIVLLGLFCLLYILNPTAGIFELIPDNLPIIGNLDEAAAVAGLLMCLRYFGIELPDFFRRHEKPADDITIK